MGKEKWVDRDHYRTVSDDGRRSYLYKTNGWFSYPEEIADHHKDGTTDAYEVDDSPLAGIFSDFKGKHKGKSKDC